MEGLFYKYPSIENTYNEKFLGLVKDNGFSGQSFCISEKVHGSNLQVGYSLTEDKFIFGSRSNILKEDESFYNYLECMAPLKSKVKELAVWMKNRFLIGKQELLDVTVYGEIFGGSYPHPMVPRDSHAVRVNKGVFYSPKNQWLAFDIAYSLKGLPEHKFLCGLEFVNLCRKFGIPFIPVLKVVPDLESALRFEPVFKSGIYRFFELPELADNMAEGVVIRGWYRDLWAGGHRVILKNKCEKFREKKSEKKIVINEEYPLHVEAAIREAAAYVNEARVQNAVSKVGGQALENIGKVIAMVNADILEEYEKMGGIINTLGKQERHIVKKALNDMVVAEVKKVFFKDKSSV